jgi:hypothetical protein
MKARKLAYSGLPDERNTSRTIGGAVLDRLGQ